MSKNVNPFGTPASSADVAEQPTKTAAKTAAAPAEEAKEPKETKPTKSAEPAANSTAPANSTVSPFGDTAAQANKPHKSHKGLIIGLLVGLLVVVAAVVGIILFINMNKVTADDYDQAMTKLEAAYDTVNDYDSDINLSSSDIKDMDESDLNDLLDKANKTLDDGQKQLDAVAQLKAVKKDEDAKSKFDKMNQAYGDMKDKTKSYIDTIKSVLPVYSAITASTDVDYSSDSYYKDMGDVYQKIADAADKADTKDKDVKSALSDMKSAAQSYADYYKKKANDEDVSYSSISSASRKFSNASSKISSALSPTELTKASSSFSKAYNDLDSYLSKQYYKLHK